MLVVLLINYHIQGMHALIVVYSGSTHCTLDVSLKFEKKKHQISLTFSKRLMKLCWLLPNWNQPYLIVFAASILCSVILDYQGLALLANLVFNSKHILSEKLVYCRLHPYLKGILLLLGCFLNSKV